MILRKPPRRTFAKDNNDSDEESVNLGFDKQLKRDLGTTAAGGNLNAIATNAWRAAASQVKNPVREKVRAENAAKYKRRVLVTKKSDKQADDDIYS